MAVEWHGDHPEQEQQAHDGPYTLRACRYYDHPTRSFKYTATVKGKDGWVFRSFHEDIHPMTMRGAMLLAEAFACLEREKSR